MQCLPKQILQFQTAYKPGAIRIINQAGENISSNCLFGWSSDMTCWSNWVSYDQYIKFSKHFEEEIYIRVLFNDTIAKVFIHGVLTNCYSTYFEQSNPFELQSCGENLFDPYSGMDCVVQLQQQMADSICCMFGIPVYYFRVKPDIESADYTFKEYVLHNVDDIKQIKLVTQDGQMPSSNPKFTELDFDWDADWEVEIGKNMFAQAFGDGVFPKQRDFIYIPLMKRMWTVNAAYDEKSEGFMWQSTTWKLSLIKYEDMTNVDKDGNVDDIVNDLIIKYDEIFGKKEQLEWERTTGSNQISAPDHSANNLYDISMKDAIRQKVTKGGISIVQYQYNHRSNIVARDMYRFKNKNAQIVYQNGYCGENGTLSFILQTTDDAISGQNTIINCGPVEVNLSFENGSYRLSCGSCEGIIPTFSSNLVIIRWNRHNYTTSLNVYPYVYENGRPIYMLKPEMHWFDQNGIINSSGDYNNDYIIECNPLEVSIQAYPCLITNIKLYNVDLGLEGSIMESLKYVTKHKSCVINDVARPIDGVFGYNVK